MKKTFSLLLLLTLTSLNSFAADSTAPEAPASTVVLRGAATEEQKAENGTPTDVTEAATQK